MKLHISKGNMKLGRLPNISLPPVKTCGVKPPCAKVCYAIKAYRMYVGVRNPWNENLRLWKHAPERYESQLIVWLSTHNVKYFRWHVGGDIVDLAYLTMMDYVACMYPDIKFLCFTKRYDLLEALPDYAGNLTLVASRWPGLKWPEYVATWYPQAWMYDPKHVDVYIPKTARVCPGSCDKCNCKRCWYLQAGHSVVFNLH